MTTAGDVGPAPMVRVGVQAPLKRENPLKKQGKKMKTFKEFRTDEINIVEAKNPSLEEIYDDFANAYRTLITAISKTGKEGKAAEKQLEKIWGDIDNIVDLIVSK